MTFPTAAVDADVDADADADADAPAPIPTLESHTPRAVCERCRRPVSVCFCAHLPRFQPSTHVVFLQHPRERKVPISTCRMAHLAFDGSELHHGVRFEGNERVEALGTEEGVALLFPSDGARDPQSLPPGWLKTLVVVDGTWSQARKIVERNPLLSSLPRLGLAPSRPGNYRIRLEPAEHCVSTIEAVVEVLGLLEGDVDRYRGALVAFDHMVDTQIAKRAERTGPSRYRRKRERTPRPAHLPAELWDEHGRPRRDAVVLYAEANAGADPEGHPIPQRVLHVLAARPSTGERIEILVRPDGPLGASVPRQLEMDGARFADGIAIDEALARLTAFTGDSLLCGWGRFARELVGISPLTHGGAPRPFLDLRVAASRRLKRRSGGIEQAAMDVGKASRLEKPPTRQWADGRGGTRIAALETLLAVFLRELDAAG